MRIVTTTPIETHNGRFELVIFSPDDLGREHVALVRGDVGHRASVPVRVHSSCLAADVFGGTRCDSGVQLDRFLGLLGSLNCGVLLYLQQEGRGHGLAHAAKAYRLQREGMDTVDADGALGAPFDRRNYATAADMLDALEVRSIELYTNNLDKAHQLRWCGVRVDRVCPFDVDGTDESARLRNTLSERAGHLPLTGLAIAAK